MTERSLKDARYAAKIRLRSSFDENYVHISAKRAQTAAIARETLMQRRHNFLPCIQEHNAQQVPRSTLDAAAMIGAIESDQGRNLDLVSPGHYPWNAAIIEQDRRHQQHEIWREEQYLLHQRRYRSLVPRLACRSRNLRDMRQWYINYEFTSGDRKPAILDHEQANQESEETAIEETDSSNDELEESTLETKTEAETLEDNHNLDTPVIPKSTQSYSWLETLKQCAVQ